MQKRVCRFVSALAALVAIAHLFGWDLVTALVAGGTFTAIGMILDDRLEFADATALGTGGTGRALVGDVIDMGSAFKNQLDLLYLVIQVDTAVTSAGAATVSLELCSDAQAAIATDGTATMHWKSADTPKATLVAGYLVAVVPLQGFKPDYERYLGLLQNVGTAALTAGKINAFLTHDPKQWVALDNAIPAA